MNDKPKTPQSQLDSVARYSAKKLQVGFSGKLSQAQAALLKPHRKVRPNGKLESEGLAIKRMALEAITTKNEEMKDYIAEAILLNKVSGASWCSDSKLENVKVELGELDATELIVYDASMLIDGVTQAIKGHVHLRNMQVYGEWWPRQSK